MTPENAIWSTAAAIIALAGKYFFDRWNKAADRRAEMADPDSVFITARECRHNRQNYTNSVNLQVQQLTMQLDEMKGELHAIRGILLVVAMQGGIPVEKLTELTK